jgi:hypothetical protein
MRQEHTMQIPWPITIVAVLIARAYCIFGVIVGTVQTVSSGPAPSWWDFIASNALRVLLPAFVVGAVAWIIERNIRRSRRTGAERRGFDVFPPDGDGPGTA